MALYVFAPSDSEFAIRINIKLGCVVKICTTKRSPLRPTSGPWGKTDKGILYL